MRSKPAVAPPEFTHADQLASHAVGIWRGAPIICAAAIRHPNPTVRSEAEALLLQLSAAVQAFEDRHGAEPHRGRPHWITESEWYTREDYKKPGHQPEWTHTPGPWTPDHVFTEADRRLCLVAPELLQAADLWMWDAIGGEVVVPHGDVTYWMYDLIYRATGTSPF